MHVVLQHVAAVYMLLAPYRTHARVHGLEWLCVTNAAVLLCVAQVQLHTTFHYPPTPPVEGESPDKLQNGVTEAATGPLPVTDGASMHPEAAKMAASQSQHLPPVGSSQSFQSLPTPPTPELALQPQPMQQNGVHTSNGELQAVEQATCPPVNGQVTTYGAALADPSKQLYQWQAGSNFCAVMGPQFAPAAAAGFTSRRPPPLYYQPEKNIAGNVAAAQPGPLRSPMSEFVVMKECMDGEREGGCIQLLCTMEECVVTGSVVVNFFVAG